MTKAPHFCYQMGSFVGYRFRNCSRRLPKPESFNFALLPGCAAGGAHLNVAHADPAVGDTTPVDTVDGGQLIDRNRGTGGQAADDGIVGAGACADIHIGSHSALIAGGGNGDGAIVIAAAVQANVGHAYPLVGADAAPRLIADGYGFVNGDLSAGGQGADSGIVGTCAAADVQTGGADNRTGAGRSGGGRGRGGSGNIGQHDVGHADPLVGADAAPLSAVDGDALIDVHGGAAGKAAHAGVVRARAVTDVQVGVGTDGTGGNHGAAAAGVGAGAGADGAELDVVHADPALVGLTPDHTVCIALRVDLYHGALGVVGDGGVAETRAAADAQASSGDGAGLIGGGGAIVAAGAFPDHAAGASGASGIAGASGVGAGGIQLHIAQGDPAVIADAAPEGAANVDGLIDAYALAVIGGADHGVVGACAAADVHAGVADHGAGGHDGGAAAGAAGIAAGGGTAGNIVGVGELQPAVNAAAPQHIANLGGFHDHELRAGGNGTGLGIVAACAVAQIGVSAGDGHGSAILCIQSPSGSGRIQVLHAGAAGGGSEPAAEGNTGLAGIGCQDAHIGAGQVSLHLILAAGTGSAAVRVKDDVCIPGRSGFAVDAVEVQVGLCQAAVKQGGVGGGTHVCPQGDGEQEGVHIGVAGHGLVEAAALGRPVGAAVEAEADQRIVLILVQIQIGAGGELIDFGVDGVQPVAQRQVGLCFGHGLAGDAGGAVADGPLVHIPVGRGAEALELFDQADHIFTVIQVRGSLGGDNSQGEQTDDKHQSHDHASDSSFHKLLAPLSVLMGSL